MGKMSEILGQRKQKVCRQALTAPGSLSLTTKYNAPPPTPKEKRTTAHHKTIKSVHGTKTWLPNTPRLVVDLIIASQ